MSAQTRLPLPFAPLSPSPSPTPSLPASTHAHPSWPGTLSSQGPFHTCKTQRPRCPRPLRLPCLASAGGAGAEAKKTCRHCKKQFTDSENHPTACRYHTAHYGGETKRKFESVYTGGTMNTADGGKITAYWHCCGNHDAFDIGCVASPHQSFDD